MMQYAGELAGLTTAVAWALSSQINGYMGGIVGASGITLLRLPFQLVFLGLFCLAGGAAVAFDGASFALLFFSAITGLAIGDFALYKCMTIVGARAGILLLSLCTSFTAVFGVLFLGEALSWQMAAGIILATAGVAFVVTERAENTPLLGRDEPGPAAKRQGVLLGLFGAAAFAVNIIFLRAAMKGGLDPLWAGFLRVAMAGSCLWILGYSLGWSQAAARGLQKTRGLFFLLLLSCFLGALGMWTSCITLRHLPAGVGATIMGLQPIWVIISHAVWTRKLPSQRMLFGALIAFGGTAVVCLR